MPPRPDTDPLGYPMILFGPVVSKIAKIVTGLFVAVPDEPAGLAALDADPALELEPEPPHPTTNANRPATESAVEMRLLLAALSSVGLLGGPPPTTGPTPREPSVATR